MKSTTTFNDLREADACTTRYKHLAKALGGITRYGRDTPISLLQILDICGMADAVWAVERAVFTPPISDALYSFVEESEEVINDAHVEAKMDIYTRTESIELAHEAALKAEKLEEKKQVARLRKRLTRGKKNV